MMKNILSLAIAFLFGATSFAQSTDVIMNPTTDGTTVFTCLGGLYDSGGTGAGTDYQNNESLVITVCPDVPGDFMTLLWTVFDLDPTDNVSGPGTDADNITVYDGDNTGAPTLGTYYSGDLTPGDLFGATPANPTGCLTIEFNSNANGTGNFNAQLSCETPCDPPTAEGMILNADNAQGDSIAVCVGETVSFQDNGSTAGPSGLFNLDQWVWQWFDGTPNDTLPNGGQIDHVFDIPGQYVVQMQVIDDNGCNNLNATDIQVFVTTYPTFDPFPNDTTLCLGETVDLEAFPDAYEVQWSGFPLGIYIDDNCMEDLTGIVQETPMMITGYDSNISLDNGNPDILSICVEMEHSFLGDFVLQVQCPTGQIMTLHQQGGGGTDLGISGPGIIDCNDLSTFGTPYQYCFTAGAAQTWVDAAATVTTMPAGDYLPVDPLGFAALDGCPINGQWTMLFTDLWGADDGSMPGWSINFDPALDPPVTVFTPDIGTASDSSWWDLTSPYIVSNTADGNAITVTPGATGVFGYTYNVINSFGCAFDSTVFITVDPAPVVSAGLDTSVCDGQPVIIGDTGGGGGGISCDYVLDLIDSFGDSWNGNTIDVYINGVPTNYTVATGSGATFNIPVNHGDVIDLQWNATGAWQSECEIYFYDPDGNLVHSDGVGFTTPSTAMFTFTADCFGGLVFDWTPDNGSLDDTTIPNPEASPATSTTYTLTVFPVGHPDCVTTDDVTVLIGGGMDAGTDSSAILCFEGAAEDLFVYLGGTPQLGGQWYNPAGQAISMPIQPDTIANGLYEYVRDSAGCQASAFIDVLVHQITGTTVVTNSDCQACNGAIQLVCIDGMGPLQYSDDAGATFQMGDTFSALCGAVAPGVNYSFVIQDSIGCVVTVDDDVLDDNFPQIDNAVTVDSDCQANNGQVDIATASSGGTAPYQYSVDGITAFQNLPITNLTPSIPGTYDLILQDAFGCTDTVQITIDEINVPSLNALAPVDASCYTVCDGSILLAGTNLISFSIDNGTSFQGTGDFNGLCAGTYDVVVDNGFGCQVTDQFVINEPTPLQIDFLSPDQIICPGHDATVIVTGSGGNGNYTFDWESGGNSLGTGATIDFATTGNMVVCVTMSEDCPSPTVTQCTNITQPAPVSPMMTSDIVSGCQEDPVTVTFTNLSTATNIASTTWMFSDGSQIIANGTNPVVHTFDQVGFWDVTMSVLTDEGCVHDTTFNSYIEVFEHPNAMFSSQPIPATIYDTEIDFIDHSSDDVIQWSWYTAGGSPASSSIANPTVLYQEGEPGDYPVMLYVWNDNNCMDSVYGMVNIVNDVTLYAPNIFTPDGDEYNENWRVYIDGIDVYDFHLTMFNRWGEVVWESYDPGASWDGTYGGYNLVPCDVYVWRLVTRSPLSDKMYLFKGFVTVLY